MVISVVFRNTPKIYDYYCDLPVKKGDLVVVPTGSFPFRDFAVVTVVNIKEDSPNAKLWVAQKVEVKAFNSHYEEKEMLA